MVKFITITFEKILIDNYNTSFETSTDTEVLYEFLINFGIGYLAELDGIFALIL